MLDRGADLVYLFNHFNPGDFRRKSPGADGRTVERNDSGQKVIWLESTIVP